MSNLTKWCPGCETEKSIDDFSKKGQNCRLCLQEYYQENKEIILTQKADKYAKTEKIERQIKKEERIKFVEAGGIRPDVRRFSLDMINNIVNEKYDGKCL